MTIIKPLRYFCSLYYFVFCTWYVTNNFSGKPLQFSGFSATESAHIAAKTPNRCYIANQEINVTGSRDRKWLLTVMCGFPRNAKLMRAKAWQEVISGGRDVLLTLKAESNLLDQL